VLRSGRHQGFSFKDIRVLVVEDQDFNRMVVRQLLVKYGCGKVVGCANGEQALVTAQEVAHGFDIVIADFQMPVMNGLQLLKEVRTGARGFPRDIPFIMLTGHADRFIVAAAFSLDVDSFVVKPVSAETLKARLTHVLSTDRPIKRAFDYRDVEVDPAAISGSVSEPTVDLKRILDTADEETIRVGGVDVRVYRRQIDAVKAGDVVVRPVRTQGGQVLVPENTELSQHTIDRLRELAEVGERVKDFYIRVPETAGT
jgi:CheY-like chemotaxis protein